MEKTGRKNAAGGWVLGEFLRRIASAGMLFMAVVGIALGFLIRGLPVFEGSVGSRTSWVMLGRDDAGVRRLLRVLPPSPMRHGAGDCGQSAKSAISSTIAVAQRGCAFAHDVKEALGGPGNVDHIVMTPAGIWVVETKSDWLCKERFRRALRQVAENVRRVRPSRRDVASRSRRARDREPCQ